VSRQKASPHHLQHGPDVTIDRAAPPTTSRSTEGGGTFTEAAEESGGLRRS